MRFRVKLVNKGTWKRLGILAIVIIIALCTCWWVMIRMPGSSYAGPLPSADDATTTLAARLKREVEVLANDYGPRNRWSPVRYQKAADHLEAALRAAGYDVERQPSPPANPQATPGNLIVELRGSTAPEEIVIVGAHYDSFADSPGANDNGSGTAAVVALAELMVDSKPERTLRFVLFVDEEPPNFQSEEMGSLVYARRCAERNENIAAMISVETIGYYDDAAESQKYPAPFGALYPDRGNFVGFVGNVKSRGLLREVIGAFRDTTKFPSEGGALPSGVAGVGWSDHWAFWQIGAPALMVTDTAPFRYPYYHTPEDKPEKLNFEHMARVTLGIERVVRRVARAAD